MPHPPPPHRPSSEGISGRFAAVHPCKDTFGAPVPLHPQVPLPPVSPKSSVAASTMTASLHKHALSKERPGLMNLTDTNAMQWALPNDLYRMGQDDGGFHLPLQYPSESAPFCGFGNALPYNENYDLAYSAPLSSCPRTYANGLDLTGLPMDIPDSYPPAAYQIEPQRPHEMDLADSAINGKFMQLRHDHDPCSPAIKHEDYIGTGYGTPYDSDVTRSSTPNGDPPMPPHHCIPEATGDDGAVDKEQPYAQLIFRALKEAPNNTMILRDIYDWFKNNTDKAAEKETKGWQNSIRHNLSMNGAFEKVDHPSEESKKGFMWRLTEEAIRDGVKSTTRYRSKQPNKRGHRSHNPLPQRQASGAKGGQASRRSARMRRGNRMTDAYKSGPYRSVPAAYEPCAVDVTMPYSAYYGSPTESEIVFLKEDDYSSMLRIPNMNLFDKPPYTGTPLSQQTTAYGGDSAFIDLPLNPADPLFTNSPSPTVDEPRTPDSPTGGWATEVAMAGGGGPETFFDVGHSEFPV